MPPRRRPPFRRRFPGSLPDRSPARPLLQRAHHQMELGDYARAANSFERLAEGAEQRGMLRQAPRLFLLAGKAAFLSDQEERGKKHLMKGLNMLAEHEMWGILSVSGPRTIRELEQQGFPDFANQVKKWLDTTLPESTHPPREIRSAGGRRAPLPTKCPSCGGPIRSDEVEWADPATAVCPYCGSGVRRGER